MPIFRWILFVVLLLVTFSACQSNSGEEEAVWRKGNLHTHSLWSDGDDYPEMIIKWYKEKGYDFLALSDHNTLAEEEYWTPAHFNRGGEAAFQRYADTFGTPWVEQKIENDTLWVRLKTYAEYTSHFEESGEFLLIKSEEITDGFDRKPIHINATNIAEFIEPQGGTSVRDVMQRNIDAVLSQRSQLDIPMFPHINHPNFGWAITAEDLIALEGEQFFEVYNGHPAVHNYGDGDRPGMELMWDIILTRRILNNQEIMFGIAVDDSHNYHEEGLEVSNTGRGWVMVNSASLNAESVVNAMEAGDFYSSTGVVLDAINKDEDGLDITIAAEEGVTYTTSFIGTRAGHDSTSSRVEIDGAAITRKYSDEVGAVLATVEGSAPSYMFKGDELYVRAKIVSSKLKMNPYQENEKEVAWTQPVNTQPVNTATRNIEP